MTKADLAKKIQDGTGCSKTEASNLLEAVLSIMKDTLDSGENLKVSGFGNFEVKQKKNRKGRNPVTGETITIEARKIVTFKPSNKLRDMINVGRG